MNTFFYAFLAAAVTSLAMTPVIRDYAKRRGWVDKPDGGRKSHFEPMPVGGGVAIYACLLFSLALVAFLHTAVSDQLWANAYLVLRVLLLSGAMMLVGLWDDSKNLKPWMKFTAEVLIALLCWLLDFRILFTWQHHGTAFMLGVFSLPLTVIWIVGVTNAFNLIDGIDGLAAGAALFAMISMLVVSVTNVLPIPTVVLAALAGATLGFLRYNFNPASIFLGDSGSLLLGFMLALLAIMGSQKSSTAFAVAVPIVAFGLPVIDTAVTMIRRFLSGKSMFVGDRRHIHHILLERGLTPRHAVILLYGVCGIFGLFSLFFLNPNGPAIGFALAIVGVFVWFGIQQLKYPELRELNAHFSRAIQNQRKLIQGSVAIGKMTDGFRTAECVSDLLESLSSTVTELDFCKVELHLPRTVGDLTSSLPSKWHEISGHPDFYCLRWIGADSSIRDLNAGMVGHRSSDIADSRNSISTREFVLEFTLPLGDQASVGNHKKDDAGILKFFHADTGVYPCSAISLLSGNSWLELQMALIRIRPQTSSRQTAKFKVANRV